MNTCSDLSLATLELKEAENNWLSRCAEFGSAYADAALEYRSVLEAQEKLDKEQAEKTAELVIAALSLCGGSILTCMFGTSAAKGLAGPFVRDKALGLATRRGWDSAKAAIRWTDQSATAKFVMGDLWDRAAKQVKPELKTQFETLQRRAAVPVGGRDDKKIAQVVQNGLENMVRDWSNCVNRTLRWVYENLDGDDAVNELVRTSPFFASPRKPTPVPAKADRIELSFWMTYVLERDYLQVTTLRKYTDHGAWAIDRSVRKPIVAEAWSKSYPFDRKLTSGFRQVHQSVGYYEVGDRIINRINTLYGKVFGGPFFLRGTDLYGNISQETIRCAQTAIVRLADSNASDIRTSLPGANALP